MSEKKEEKWIEVVPFDFCGAYRTQGGTFPGNDRSIADANAAKRRSHGPLLVRIDEPKNP